ncbi:DUF3108 domain-containing protein [Pseudomonadota bacterium]|jgi:hypothetical protein|nr:DUF3108 domain-containing protein [Pseudomonadota bacterium]|tara:strand:+ start:1679 stop:2359 length:681 start_codon:yes stop_codon:yes gene_type:complete
MYKYLGILFFLISADITAQEIPDYKGEYVFTNSRVSMEGIRELITHQEAGKRSIQFNAKFPLGRIKIISDFTENNNLMTSTKYYVDVKWTLISDKRTLIFDQASKTLTSKGKFEWSQDLLEDENVFDPLNVQIQIRKKVMKGLQEFSLMLPDLKTGAIEANNYKVVDKGSFEVDGTNYPCIIVERFRLQDDRTTRYFLAPDLDYLIIKVEDEDQDGDTMLELKKLY